jgi:hypothetical protein
MKTDKPYEIVNVWLVGYTDGYTHFFHGNLAATTESRAKALATAKEGGYGVVEPRKAIKIGDDYFLITNTEPLDINGEKTKMTEKIREQALAKLSNEEKKVLGIKENVNDYSEIA